MFNLAGREAGGQYLQCELALDDHPVPWLWRWSQSPAIVSTDCMTC